MRQPNEIVCPNGKTLEEVLRLHSLWLEYHPKGERANLQGADLQDANLQGTDLQDACLQGANLQGANLWNANLQDADLRNVILSDAILLNAILLNANLRNANLRNANLQDANLQDASLQDACLHNTIGNGKEIKTLQTEKYTINLCKDRLQIGCKNYSLSEWQAFTDDEIAEMDYAALQWWEKNKVMVFAWVDSVKD